jgi:hypothetical protein
MLLREFAECRGSPAGAMAKFFCASEETVRAKARAVNSVFLVQLRKRVAADFANGHG